MPGASLLQRAACHICKGANVREGGREGGGGEGEREREREREKAGYVSVLEGEGAADLRVESS